MLTKLPKRMRDSLAAAGGIVGLFSTVSSIIGYSLRDIMPRASIPITVLVVIVSYVCLSALVYCIIGRLFRKKVNLIINGTPVEICYGDIFSMDGLRVIGCDTHFDTRADNVVISKTSLHGRLVLEFGDIPSIKSAVSSAARRLNLAPDQFGQYSFPLGSIVKYQKEDSDDVYLLLAMTELNDDYESHTYTIKFEQMLMKMWKEISRVYNGAPVVIPLLGAGMTRFDDGIKDKSTLLRCMLCTMNASGVKLKSVKIVIDQKELNEQKETPIPLYEFNNLLQIVPGLTNKH